MADLELSPLAAAYARARGADRQASFGDFAAFSRTGRPGGSAGALARGLGRRDRAGLRAGRAGGAPAQEGRQLPGDGDRPGLDAARPWSDARCSGSPSSSRATTPTVTLGEVVTARQGAVRGGEARPAAGGHHPQVHAVQQHRAGGGRSGDRGRGRAAVADPLHAAGLLQGGAVVAAAAPPDAEPPVRRRGVSRSERDNATEAWLRGRSRPRRWWTRPPRSPHEEQAAWIKQLRGVALRQRRPDPVPRQPGPGGRDGRRVRLAAGRLDPDGRGARGRRRARHGDDVLRAAPLPPLTSRREPSPGRYRRDGRPVVRYVVGYVRCLKRLIRRPRRWPQSQQADAWVADLRGWRVRISNGRTAARYAVQIRRSLDGARSTAPYAGLNR